MPSLALLGDYSPSVPAHQAIPAAVTLANPHATWTWIPTAALARTDLTPFTHLWAVPASPYADTAAVLRAICHARENHIPFLGTCGGFQHALLEYARNVLNLPNADHAETNPTGDTLILSPLACPLVEVAAPLHLTPGSRLARVYGALAVTETYRCRFGPNPAYMPLFEQAPLTFSAHDTDGSPRGFELPEHLHPFYLATLFQPERSALEAKPRPHPLIRAFLQ